MKLRKITLAVLLLTIFNFGCKKEEDDYVIAERDLMEVYLEDIQEIEEYLSTHTYNYGDFDFDNPYSLQNDTFQVQISEIEDGNTTAIPLSDRPELMSKVVTLNDIDYTVYILKIREGLGSNLHNLDEAIAMYKGNLLDNEVFDSSIAPVSFNLTGVGSTPGVVPGFREGLTEFKTSTGYVENPDGTLEYREHGIGVVFVPSGLGYFSMTAPGVPSYSPLVFSMYLIERSNTDFDLDYIPSHLEDLDGDGDGLDEDTDGDLLVNFIDNDDDGDGILTRDEVEPMQYDEDGSMNPFTTKAEAQAYYDANAADNEIFVKIEYLSTGNYRLHTTILTDSNDDGIPDYLDPSM